MSEGGKTEGSGRMVGYVAAPCLPGHETRIDEDICKGWRAIADALDIGVTVAIQRAGRPVDPLPVWVDHKGRPFAFSTALRDWVRRQIHAYQTKRERAELERVRARRRAKRISPSDQRVLDKPPSKRRALR